MSLNLCLLPSYIYLKFGIDVKKNTKLFVLVYCLPLCVSMLSAEEILFHSSILYGASKRRNKHDEGKWNSIVNIISKYFTGAPPVTNAKSAIFNLTKLIEIRCTNSE